MKRKKNILDLFEQDEVKEAPISETAVTMEESAPIAVEVYDAIAVKERRHQLIAYHRAHKKQVLMTGALIECQKEKVRLEKIYKADRTVCLRVK